MLKKSNKIRKLDDKIAKLDKIRYNSLMITKDNNNFNEKQENIHKYHRRRLREELLLNGFNTSEHKVLEYLLFYCHAQKDTNPLAHKLINKFGSFKNVLEAGYSDLIKIDGVGETTAHYLSSIVKIFDYYNNQKLNEMNTKIQTRKDYAEYFNLKISNLKQESLLAIALNSKRELIASKVIRTGSELEVNIDYMEIITFLNQHKCKTVILMHNHPSGNSTPSSSDLISTKELYIKLALLQIVLVDHMIISSSGYYSFDEDGLIEQYELELKKNPFFK